MKMQKSARLPFKKIKVGMTRNFDVLITARLVADFARLSGDRNPLHVDEKFARKTRFKRKVAHGMLVSSFFSRLVGMCLPGEGALYFSQTLHFKRPTFEGDRVRVEGRVTRKSLKLKLLTIETRIVKSTGEIVVEGEAKVFCSL